jgi:hypothetical protein
MERREERKGLLIGKVTEIPIKFRSNNDNYLENANKEVLLPFFVRTILL